MNLIIAAELSEPPSDSLMFRYFTMIAKESQYDILLETEKSMIDLYFHYLKHRGLFDYIDDILEEPNKENGIRIDREIVYPKTIVVKAITFENVLGILGRVGAIKYY